MLWGVATLGRVAGKIRVDGGKIDVNQGGTLNCVSWAWNSKMRRGSA